jgi:hypothetical protein
VDAAKHSKQATLARLEGYPSIFSISAGDDFKQCAGGRKKLISD